MSKSYFVHLLFPWNQVEVAKATALGPLRQSRPSCAAWAQRCGARSVACCALPMWWSRATGTVGCGFICPLYLFVVNSKIFQEYPKVHKNPFQVHILSTLWFHQTWLAGNFLVGNITELNGAFSIAMFDYRMVFIDMIFHTLNQLTCLSIFVSSQRLSN